MMGGSGGMMAGPGGGGMEMKAQRGRGIAPPLRAAAVPAADSLSSLPAPERAKPLDKNAYYSSTYIGGQGERERMEKLIEGGVLVNGKQIKLAAFSRDYSQAFPIPTKTALNLSADLERTRLLQEGGKTYLQVGIQGIQREAPRRPPLNVALVLDRSGSMAEEGKLEFVKQAAQRFVEGLNRQDTLALVVYDDTAQTASSAAPVTNKARLKQIIASLTPGGGTNIYEGLQRGYREVSKQAHGEAVNVVLLMSDGQVTVGIHDPNAFRNLASQHFDNDITTTTIGVGLDYNEDLMLSLAQAGHGNYHFIKDGSSIDRLLKQELQELTHIIAKALKVRIVLDEDVDLVKVFGATRLSEEERRAVRAEEKKIDRKIYEELGIAPDRQKDQEPGLKMFIPHFFLGDSHVIMLEIRVPPGRGTRHVADVSLKYKDLVFRQNREPQVHVTLGYTDRKAEMIASIQRPVKKNLLGFQTGEALMAAARLIDAGRTAEAARVINEQMTLLGVAAREWNDRDLDREGQLLARYYEVLREIGSRNIASSDVGRYLSKSLSYSGYRMTR
jgi:Mg-chelatase subunit ChlD